jgi:hypothetical protein
MKIDMFSTPPTPQERQAIRDFMDEVDAIRGLPRDEFEMELRPILRRLRRYPRSFAFVKRAIREHE